MVSLAAMVSPAPVEGKTFEKLDHTIQGSGSRIRFRGRGFEVRVQGFRVLEFGGVMVLLGDLSFAVIPEKEQEELEVEAVEGGEGELSEEEEGKTPAFIVKGLTQYDACFYCEGLRK